MKLIRPFAVVAAILCIGVALPKTSSPRGPGNSASQAGDEWAIPADAQAKAIEALQALGPDRGAKRITFKIVDIIGVSKDIKASRVEVLKAMKDLSAKESGTEIQIDLPGDVLFDFDKADIRSDAVEFLKKVAFIIKAYKSPKVTVAGHTDSQGEEAYNQILSEKRAESVKAWLVSSGGIEARILKMIGYGETQPAAPNTQPDGSDNPAGRQKNRRVEILIEKQ